MLIDDFSRGDLVSSLGTAWRAVSDRVMGGVSDAGLGHARVEGRGCLRLSGRVRLENSGGFIQAALDLSTTGDTVDASRYRGLRLVVRGNEETYSLHLRTPDSVLTSSSMMSTMSSSTDSGLAPGSVAVTVRIGNSMLGYWSTPRRL